MTVGTVMKRPRRERPRIQVFLSIVFAAFVWICTVGLNPLSSVTAVDTYTRSGSQQYLILYALLAVVALAAGWSRIRVLVKLFDVWIFALLLWAAITLRVSDHASQAMLDLAKQIIYLVGCAAFVSLFRTERDLIQALKVIFLLIVGLDLAAILLVPGLAIHQATDAQADTVAGAWKGLHEHKGKFGEVLAVTVILFYFSWRQKGRRRDLAFAGVIYLLTLPADAKTAFGCILLAVMATELLVLIASYASRAAMTLFLLPLAAMLLGIVVLLMPEDMFDKISFTGRTRVWAFLWNYSKDHLWMGSGFSSFFTGLDSPLYRSGDPFLMGIGNAHNTFLDMLATVGWPGMILSILAFFVMPIARSYRRLTFDPKVQLWVNIIFLVTFTSVTGVSYFQNQRADGMILPIAIFALRRFHSGAALRVKRRAPVPIDPHLQGVGPATAGVA